MFCADLQKEFSFIHSSLPSSNNTDCLMNYLYDKVSMKDNINSILIQLGTATVTVTIWSIFSRKVNPNISVILFSPFSCLYSILLFRSSPFSLPLKILSHSYNACVHYVFISGWIKTNDINKKVKPNNCFSPLFAFTGPASDDTSARFCGSGPRSQLRHYTECQRAPSGGR